MSEVRYLDLADYLLIAEAVLETPAEEVSLVIRVGTELAGLFELDERSVTVFGNGVPRRVTQTLLPNRDRHQPFSFWAAECTNAEITSGMEVVNTGAVWRFD